MKLWSTNFKFIAGSKGKTIDLGKTVLPENEIYGSWIKTLDPKKKSLFHCNFSLFLRMALTYYRTNGRKDLF